MVDNQHGRFPLTLCGNGPSYTSPANDQGTLVKNSDGSYTYTAKDQTKSNFDSTGRMTSQVDPHSLGQTMTYYSPLKTITQPDGGVATFTYNMSNLLAWVELTRRLLPDDQLRRQQQPHRSGRCGGRASTPSPTTDRTWLVNEQVGPLNTTYGYASDGTLNTINRGLGSVTTITAEATQGLSRPGTAINAAVRQSVATVTDPLNHRTTTYLARLAGPHPPVADVADGALQTWTLDAAGNPDGLHRPAWDESRRWSTSGFPKT